MSLNAEQQKELAQFPSALRALVEAELAAGNTIDEIGHSHPAPPVGAYIKLAKKISTRPRASGSGLSFYERNSSLYSGEFTDAKRFFFVLEAPNPPPPEPDMDAIRKAHEAKPDALAKFAARQAGAEWAGVDAPLSSAASGSPEPNAVGNRSAPGDASASSTSVTETATGWTRVLHFRDKRPPHEVQFALERELMVLFNAAVEGGQLRMNAVANVTGARYHFELRFVAARTFHNYFSLHTEASWADADTKHHDYFRKTSVSWYQFWTRDLAPTAPLAAAEEQGERYRKYSEATLHAQRHLDSVAAVQRALVEGVKRGGTFGTSHKEGGTNIFWRNGKFIRSDYGDYPGVKEFSDESEFLQMLWQFYQFDVKRHADTQELPALDAWKLILRRMSSVSPPHPDDLRSGGFSGSSGAVTGLASLPQKLGGATMFPLYSTPLAKGLVIGVLGLLTAGLVAWHFLSIKSTGLPLGAAARTPTHILQLVHTTERYLPTLHRIPGKDRFRIDLLAISIADPTHQETFTLIRQQQANASTPMTKILGADGNVVWIQALDLFAVNLKTKHIARRVDLRKRNPELELFLNSARSEFTDRFVAVSPDWSQAYEFAAETLKATACPPPSRGSWLEEQSKDRLEKSLCSGGLISANEWIAALTADDAKNNFKPGFSLPRDFSASDKDQIRQLYRGNLETSESRSRIGSCERLTTTEYRAATFLRAKPGGSVRHEAQPDSFFLLHRVGTEPLAPFTLVRIAPDGKPLWNTATGIGRLAQVLPGPDCIALLGERPPVPNKVSEPIVTLVNVASGAVVGTVSLWR